MSTSRETYIDHIAVAVIVENPFAAIGKHNRYQLPELRERDRSETVRGLCNLWLIEGGLNRRQGITPLNGLRCTVRRIVVNQIGVAD